MQQSKILGGMNHTHLEEDHHSKSKSASEHKKKDHEQQPKTPDFKPETKIEAITEESKRRSMHSASQSDIPLPRKSDLSAPRKSDISPLNVSMTPILAQKSDSRNISNNNPNPFFSEFEANTRL